MEDIQVKFPEEVDVPIKNFFDELAGGKFMERKMGRMEQMFFDIEDAAVGEFDEDGPTVDFLEQESSSNLFTKCK